MKDREIYDFLAERIDGLKKEERRERDADQRKVYDEVFDHSTLMVIYNFMSEGVIDTVEKGEARLKVTFRTEDPPPAFFLTVAMGIVPGERFDWAVQKVTELGAAAVVPLVTERTEGVFRPPWKRLDRLRRVAVSACKQCGRARFPDLSEPVGIEDLDPGSYDIAVAFWEDEGAPGLVPRGAGEPRPGRGLMVVGPVGGFSPGEARYLESRGCVLAGLGPRVLRTETAVAAGAALMQYLYGDMGKNSSEFRVKSSE